MSSERTTAAMLHAARGGDGEQFGRLLEQYRGYLLMLGRRYLSDRMRRRVDPADLVQSTFLEAQRDWQGFRGSSAGEFAAWLQQILKNNVAAAVARHVTAQKRSIQREASPAPGASSAGDWLAQIAADHSTPSRRMIRAEAGLALLESLHQLPEGQAEALRQRYLEGSTLVEIADRMGKSETAVAGLLKRGLAKLRTLLQGQEGLA